MTITIDYWLLGTFLWVYQRLWLLLDSIDYVPNLINHCIFLNFLWTESNMEFPSRNSSGCSLCYCGWKKSCTSWWMVYPIIYRVSTIQGGAGFLPLTVGFRMPCLHNKCLELGASFPVGASRKRWACAILQFANLVVTTNNKIIPLLLIHFNNHQVIIIRYYPLVLITRLFYCNPFYCE
jgi:hypothetical protein